MFESLRSRARQWIGDAALSRVTKNASMLFGAETVVMLIGAVQFPLVTRLLGVENYGAWGVVISWVGLIGQILAFRLWETVIKYFSQFMTNDDELRALALLKLCLLIDFIVGVVTFAIVSASASVAAGFVLKARADGADLIRLEAFNMLMGVSMSVWMALLRVFDRFKFISAYNVASAVALFVFWMSALALHSGIGGLILATAFVKFGQTVTLAALASRDLRRRFRGRWFNADVSTLRGHRREIWVMLFSMNIDTFRKIVSNNVDMLTLGWFASPAQVGVYRLAKQLAGYFGRLINPVYDAVYPELARLHAAEGLARVRQLVWRLSRGLMASYVASVIGALLLSPLVIPLVFGPEYIPAIPVFLILLASNFWVVFLWMPGLMLALGRPRQLTTINIVNSCTSLLTMLVLTPILQALGTALAFVASSIVGTVINAWYLTRLPGLDWRKSIAEIWHRQRRMLDSD